MRGFRKLLLIGDLHCGSEVAVMPRKVKEDINGKIEIRTPNKWQWPMVEFWEYMIKEVGKVDAVAVMGDTVDGKSYADGGLGAWTTKVDLQEQSAIELLKQIRFKGEPKYYNVHGSKYHICTNPTYDGNVAKGIKAKRFGFEQKINFKQEQKKIHIAHKISVSTSSWQYRTTGIAKELVAALLNTKEIKMGKYCIVARGHAHYYVEAKFGSSRGIVNPGWQLRTSFLAQLGLNVIPKVGFNLLHIGDKRVYNDEYVAKDIEMNIPEDVI